MLVPFPFLTALVVTALSLRFALARGLPMTARILLTSAGLIAAVEAVLVSLHFGYGVEGVIVYQRVLPLSIGPLMYLGFLTLALHGMKLRLAALLHLGIAIAVMVIFFVQRTILLTSDLAILTSYAVYIVLMYRLWRGGPDALTRARLSEALRLRIWLLGAIGLLIFVLALDAAIAAAFAFGLEETAPMMVSFGTLPLTLLFLYALTRRTVTVSADKHFSVDAFVRIDRLVREAELFRDAELTPSRLARHLGDPARTVSQAINQATGLNVS
jgi:hypothetical protein